MRILDALTDIFGAYLVPATHAGLRSGRYYGGTYSGLISTALVADTIYWLPVLVPERATIVEIGVNVVTLGTATLARMGLYRLAPGTLTAVAVPAEFALSSTGAKGQTVSAKVDPGMYYLAVLFNGTCTVTCESIGGPSGPNGLLSIIHGNATPTDIGATNIGLATSYPYAALPGASVALSTAAYGANTLPHLWYRV
jgi:hypothetical protein